MRRPLALLALAFAPAFVRADEPAPAAPKVKLVVLVVFDQMRGDYIHKWQPHFGDGGFKRLQTEGAWFTDCHYPYATTATGPGHSAMLTGASPSKTGIVNNEWWDRVAGAEAYCAGTERYDLVPAATPEKEEPNDEPKPKEPLKKKPKAIGTPERLLSPTLGDVLKAETKGAGKVFGLSLKGPLRHPAERPQARRRLLVRRPLRDQHLLPRRPAQVGRRLQQVEGGRRLVRQGLDEDPARPRLREARGDRTTAPAKASAAGRGSSSPTRPTAA